MIINARILLDAPSSDYLRSTVNGAILVDDITGIIKDIGEQKTLAKRYSNECVFPIDARARPILIPGLIDVHAHLPQYPAVARKEDSLLPWLETHIFPLERQFTNGDQRGYIEAFFEDVIRSGITTVVLYSAIWQETTDIAFQIAQKSGIRAIIGKVMMDVNSYGETQSTIARKKSILQTAELIEKWHGYDNCRLEYAVSPRFAVTCSMELMQAAAQLAKKHDTYLQTHLSENHGEIEAVAELFPQSESYTDVYRKAGLLTEKTLLGHCIHLSDQELQIISDHRAKIAHCPTSNFFLNSGILPMDRIDRFGVQIGIASDVAGGPELNPWQVMRSSIEGQKARAFYDHDIPELSPTRAFHLGTAGGAEVLGKEELIGKLEVGMEADLTLVDLNNVLPLNGKYSPDDLSAEQILSALIYRGKPEATIASFVRGRQL